MSAPCPCNGKPCNAWIFVLPSTPTTASGNKRRLSVRERRSYNGWFGATGWFTKLMGVLRVDVIGDPAGVPVLAVGAEKMPAKDTAITSALENSEAGAVRKG